MIFFLTSTDYVAQYRVIGFKSRFKEFRCNWISRLLNWRFRDNKLARIIIASELVTNRRRREGRGATRGKRGGERPRGVRAFFSFSFFFFFFSKRNASSGGGKSTRTYRAETSDVIHAPLPRKGCDFPDIIHERYGRLARVI